MNDQALGGVSVLVTRPKYATESLCRAIIKLGGTALPQPGLAINPVGDDEPTLAQLERVYQADLAIFVSRPAVWFGLDRLASGRLPPRCLVLAIGPGTAAELEQAGFSTVIVAPEASSESLLDLPELAAVNKKKVLIFCARRGRVLLEQTLAERGAMVQPMYVYQREPVALDPQIASAVVDDFSRLIVTATSVASLTNLLELFAGRLPAPLQSRPLVVNSQRLADEARRLGFRQVTHAANSSESALLQTVSEVARRVKGSG